MKAVCLTLALVLTLAAPMATHGFGINVEAETSLGDHFWTVEKLREKRYGKLRLGIHERITEEALSAVESRREAAERDPKLRQQVLYGLLFNDDPGGYLFPRNPGNPKGYERADSGASIVNGIDWMEKFGVVVAKMKRLDILKREEQSDSLLLGWYFRWRAARELPELRAELKQDILWASHFGDLQYLHAMGLADDSRADILAKMRKYSEHAWSVAIGTTSFDDLQTELERAKAAAQEGAELSDRRGQLLARFDASDVLYHTQDPDEFRYRALGSILHMIQDSYAKGHAVREGWEGQNSGRIKYFQNYAEQDGDKHGVFDTPESQDVDDWDQVPGASKAMERSAGLVTYFTLQCSWGMRGDDDSPDCPENGVEGYLFDEVFEPAPQPEAETRTRSHPEILASG